MPRVVNRVIYVNPFDEMKVRRELRGVVDVAIVASDLVQKGKIYAMNRASFIGPLIEEAV